MLRRKARNLMHQCRSRYAARLLVIWQSDVVRHDHHLHLQTVAFGLLCRQTKVQPVASVVFDNQQTATIARHRHNGIQHRIYARRGKQVPTHRRRQHSFTDKPGMGWLMT